MSVQIKPAAAQRNHSIDLMRLWVAMAIVVNHTKLLSDVSPFFGSVFSNLALARYSIPFFMGISSYYYFSGLLRGKNLYKANVLAVLETYALWGGIFFCVSAAINAVKGGQPWGPFLLEQAFDFFTLGTFFHLWYFPALIYAMSIVTLVYRFRGERGLWWLTAAVAVLWLVGILGSTYYHVLGSRIPLLSRWYETLSFHVIRYDFLIGLSCFLLGFVVLKCSPWFQRLSAKAAGALVAGGYLAVVAESILIVYVFQGSDRPEMQFTIVPFTGLLILLLLRCPAPRFAPLSELFRKLANFLFFSHPLFLYAFTFGAEFLHRSLSTLALFLLTVASSLLLGWLLIRLDKPWCRALLGLVTKRSPTRGKLPPAGREGAAAHE